MNTSEVGQRLFLAQIVVMLMEPLNQKLTLAATFCRIKAGDLFLLRQNLRPSGSGPERAERNFWSVSGLRWHTKFCLSPHLLTDSKKA